MLRQANVFKLSLHENLTMVGKCFFQKRCVCSLWKVSKFPLDTKWFKTINVSIWKKHNAEHVCLTRKCVALKYISNDFVHACAHGQKNQHSCGVISVWYRQSLIRIGHKIKPPITFLFTFTRGNKLNQSPCKEHFTGNLSPEASMVKNSTIAESLPLPPHQLCLSFSSKAWLGCFFVTSPNKNDWRELCMLLLSLERKLCEQTPT